MRFQRLQIPAFGPFTNLDLQFADQPGDLHVIYGANEAGKSSLLRAIRDLLFGIHGQSTDNFLHDYAELKIRGEILNRAGQQLTFQRRKGNKNTLLDADGHQLPESALASFLGSVDQAYFSAMFGLGARELRDGAQELLRGEGDIGTALFAASMGGTPVQKVVEALQVESDELFKGRATANVSIRPAASRFKELMKQSREAIVSPEAWARIESELADANAARVALEKEVARQEDELAWIARCEDALPTVGRLGEEQRTLTSLPPLPNVAGDFALRARAAREAASGSHAEVQRLSAQIERLGVQSQACRIAPNLLVEAGSLDRLHQELGAYRDQKKTLAEQQALRAGLEPPIRAGMLNLRLTGEFAALENQRLSTPVRLACEEAAGAVKTALSEQAANSTKAEEIQNQIAKLEDQLGDFPEIDLTGLRDALAVAAEATDADRTFATSESEVKRLTREVAGQHRQIAGAPEDHDATAGLLVPAAASIRRHHEQMEGIRRDLKAAQEKGREAKVRADAIRGELTRLQRQGVLPSEGILGDARRFRDHGWELVLEEWKGGGAKEELVPGTPLEMAFPNAISNADSIADQLRLEAEAVAQAEEKRLQLGEFEKQVDDAKLKTNEFQSALDDWQRSWQADWAASGITPRLPAEMLEWRDEWNEFRTRLEKLRAAEELLQKKRRQILLAKERLAVALNRSVDMEFSSLFAAGKELVQKGEQSSGRRIEKAEQLKALKSDLAKYGQRRAQLSKAVEQSASKWASECAAVGLPAGTSPDAGLALLKERKELLALFDKWLEMNERVEVAETAIGQFERAVSNSAQKLGIEGDTTDALESTMWSALNAARQAQAQHDQLAKHIEKAESELKDARVLATRSDEALEELLDLAGLTSATELEPLLACLEKRDAVQAQIEGLRSILGGLARGRSVDEFIGKVMAEDPGTLASRKSTIEREKSEKESALQTVCQSLGQLGNEKKSLEKAGDAAADFRQQAESVAATLRQDAPRFLRLRLATFLLQRQIERFRKENQGPLLQKSGDVFRNITKGAFTGLSAEFNADDLPVLVGVRPDGSKTRVEGLSDGTRDQLFLALRIAALERHLLEHEPMPLILDDLLITFDDERAKAILPQLGALAKRTQIFLFTHHEHLVDLCRQTLGEGHFHLHRLGKAS
jgi:uncharacterized protein YhaN